MRLATSSLLLRRERQSRDQLLARLVEALLRLGDLFVDLGQLVGDLFVDLTQLGQVVGLPILFLESGTQFVRSYQRN